MVNLPIDDLTEQSLKRLRAGGDTDFARLSDWLERALVAQDEANRVMMDGVQLRMGQGAATVLAVIVAHLKGTAKKGVLHADTRAASRAGQSDTASRRAP